jgi:hypothetical protein
MVPLSIEETNDSGSENVSCSQKWAKDLGVSRAKNGKRLRSAQDEIP